VTAAWTLCLDGGSSWQCGPAGRRGRRPVADARAASAAHPGVGLRAPRHRHHGALRAQPHRHTAWQRFLPTGPLALLPLPAGRAPLLHRLVHRRGAGRRAPGPGRCGFARPSRPRPARAPRRGDGLRAARAFPLRQRHAVDYVQVPAWPWSAMRRTRFIPWPARASTSVLRTWRCWPRSWAVRRAWALPPGARCPAPLPAPAQGRQPAHDGGDGRLQTPLRQPTPCPCAGCATRGMRGVVAACPPLKRRIIREAMGVA
jgi:2-octaprenylphenol hydroxylase